MSGYQRVDAVITTKEQESEMENLPTEDSIATSKLEGDIIDIRNRKISWQGYVQGKIIDEDEYNFIMTFDPASPERKAEIFNSNTDQCIGCLWSLVTKISQDNNIQYILMLIDDLLSDDKSRVGKFHDHAKSVNTNLYTTFLNLLNRMDPIIVHQSSRIIAKLACWSKTVMPESDLKFYLSWLKGLLVPPVHEYLESEVECLQIMLRKDVYRLAFVSLDSINCIVSFLMLESAGFQLQYQLVFCLWLLAFNSDIAEKMTENNAVIPTLSDILRDTSKEKVTRIIVATLRNLFEKASEGQQAAAYAMIQSKLLPILSVLNGKTWADEDVKADIEFLYEKLNDSVQDLSTFDEYAAEVKSGRLEWSPVHRSEKFWRENSQRLNEKNYEILKILTKLLESSANPTVLAVAAHDVGEYVRHYPRGKHVLESLGCKEHVMKQMSHDDSTVRYEALLAVQKLMVHNWEYLGKQLKAS